MTLIDLSLKVDMEMYRAAQQNSGAPYGHIGTHFDVMNKEFPLAYFSRKGYVFDVHSVRNRDIDVSDVDLSRVQENMFIGFYTGWIEEHAYGTAEYSHDHPQLSHALIDALLERKVSVIGIDCAGIRRGREHTSADQQCADHGAFAVENLVSLSEIAEQDGWVIHTAPMNFTGMTGLVCRVIAEKE